MREGWTYKKLGYVCDLYQPKTISSDMLVSDGDYLVYGANGIIGRYNQYNHEASEVLVTCRGATCGTINISAPFSWINGNAMVIHPKNEDLSKSYLVYALRGIDLSDVITGAAQPQITRQSLLPKKLPIPPLSEQERIVSELDLLSSIIEKKKAQLKEYDKLAQSIFYDMFGDPVTNEKGWEVKKVGELTTEMRYGTSRPACEGGKYNYLRMGNINNEGYLNLNDLKKIDIPDNEVEKCIVKRGDVLFNRTNSLELIGKTCLFDLEEPMVIAGYLIRVRFKETILPLYFTRLFNLSEIKKKLRSMAKGAVNQANINAKELASISIPVPPLSLQQSFASKIEAIERQKALVQQSIVETQTMFDYTMDKYFG